MASNLVLLRLAAFPLMGSPGPEHLYRAVMLVGSVALAMLSG